jgi:hypothetical protein
MFPTPRADFGDFKIGRWLWLFDLIKRHHFDLLEISGNRAQPAVPCAVCTSEVSRFGIKFTDS